MIFCQVIVGCRCMWANEVDQHSHQTINTLSSHSSTAHILKQRLCCYPHNLKVVHINAQSLRRHIDQIWMIFQSQNIDLIAISETWLKPNVQSKEVAMPGYKLLRNDRLHKNGGGVAVYVRAGLKNKLLYMSPSGYSNKPEFMFIEIRLSNSDTLLFGVCYRPPNTEVFVEFEKTLLHLLSGYSNALIMGDFNADLQDKKLDLNRNQVPVMFTCCNMTILPLKPTHHLAGSHSLIDLIAVTDPRHVVHHGQLPIPNVSWHDLIYCVIGLKSTLPSKKCINSVAIYKQLLYKVGYT